MTLCTLTRFYYGVNKPKSAANVRVRQSKTTQSIIVIIFCLIWGYDFRTEFSHLGEVQSLIPDHVKVMALTATAT